MPSQTFARLEIDLINSIKMPSNFRRSVPNWFMIVNEFVVTACACLCIFMRIIMYFLC